MKSMNTTSLNTQSKMMHPARTKPATSGDFDAQFQALLSQWNHHQTLRTAGAPAADLYHSRAQLDEYRLGCR